MQTLEAVRSSCPYQWRAPANLSSVFLIQGLSRASPSQAVRTFTSTPSNLKKRKIAAPSNSPVHNDAPSKSKQAPPSQSSAGEPDPENPLDFSSLHAQWAPVDAHFRSQFQTIARGGRFNPDSIGGLKVNVKDEEGEVMTFPLRELCQVVPRSGRTISLLVNDKEYVKPLMSAVQSSKEFNQQPQRSPDNDLELLLKIEMERKEDVAKRVKETAQQWKDRVRQARTKHDKVVKAWKQDKVLTVDMARKVEGELQKVQSKKLQEVEEEEKKLLRQVEKGS